MTAADSHQDVFSSWMKSLGTGAGTDTLIRFAGSKSNSIDLTHAHPSGLSQFLMGRRTRLSMLLRDRETYLEAATVAANLVAKISELSDDRGIDVGYVAAGVTSWRALVNGRSEQFGAPVMLGKISLVRREEEDDYDVQITERASANPALLRHLARELDVHISAQQLNAAAYTTARFDPHAALSVVRRETNELPGFYAQDQILISTFADLVDPADPDHLDPTHPVIGRLIAAHAADVIEKPASEMSAAPSASVEGSESESAEAAASATEGESETPAASSSFEFPEPEVDHPSADERHPSEEFLVLDADVSQQTVLDYVAAGESVAVNAAAGTGQTQTAVNAVAMLVREGKRVLVVAERKNTARGFMNRLESLRLDSIAAHLTPQLDVEEFRSKLTQAILRNERATEPKLEKLHETLVTHRHALVDHVASLHTVRERWNCSPYQAMQELAALTSLNPAPATEVQLKRSVLDTLLDRSDVSAKLERAAELGAFTADAATKPWAGANIRNRQGADEALKLVQSLKEDFEPLKERLAKTAEESQIRPGSSFVQWREQLEMLMTVRSSLDKFEPDIFDHSVEDLIAATGSSSWRKANNVEMSSMTRSRLRRVAKEFVRPGVHLTDLHEALIDVHVQRERWQKYATSQRHPSVPLGLGDLKRDFESVAERLQKLASLLPADQALNVEEQSIEDLSKRLNDLVDDTDTLQILPERNILEDQLKERGLSEFLADLRNREVRTEMVKDELNLAWWRSALMAMISGDDFLAMSDGNMLRKIEAEYRLADAAHVQSGADRLRWSLAKNWRDALADHRGASRDLRTMLKIGDPTLEQFAALPSALVNSMVPVLVGSPLHLASNVPSTIVFDAVVLLDAYALSLRSAIGMISKSSQVIAFGDKMLGAPRSFEVSVDPTATNREPDAPLSALEQLSTVLPTCSLEKVYRGVDERLTALLSEWYYDSELERLPGSRAFSGAFPGLSADYVQDGSGVPSIPTQPVESTIAEVNRVVDMVFAHIRRRPHHSLAVIAGNELHARKIAEAIRIQLPNYRWASEFFKASEESFVVTSVQRAHSVERDAVIFALGYGRNTHGKALHQFGLLSEAQGDEYLVSALTRPRESLQLVSSLRKSDVEWDRLASAPRFFLTLVDRLLDGESGFKGEGQAIEDPLVRDLKDRLEMLGARVQQSYRGVLDIAVASLDAEIAKGQHPLAVISDGTKNYRELSVRERSRLRPQRLEAMGWRYVPLWTIDVFSDPSAVAQRLGEYLGLFSNPAATPKPEADAQQPTPEANEASESPAAAPAAAGETKAKVATSHGTTIKDIPPASAILPKVAKEDDPRAWGDFEESNRDQWLKEQRPPHWS
ncbi:DNA helicase [Neomicrococcus lactis]|uniref:DNA helicase n=1 Tax=Neomicrococcus lactis TaxID=732241 RepID=UPI0022FFD732|nr:DNA helicase [Neomicrococcus lactis]